MPIKYLQEPIKATITNPARALDVIYTNTTMRPIMVLVTCWHIIVNAANRCRINAFAAGNWQSSGGYFVPLGLGTAHSQVTILVPPGSTYEVQTDDVAPNTSVLNRWTEVEL